MIDKQTLLDWIDKGKIAEVFEALAEMGTGGYTYYEPLKEKYFSNIGNDNFNILGYYENLKDWVDISFEILSVQQKKEKTSFFEENKNDILSIMKDMRSNPNSPEPYYKMANISFLGKHYPRAIEGYEKAIELKPDFAEAHNGLGNAHYECKNWEKAIECYQKALLLKPDYTAASLSLITVEWEKEWEAGT